MTLTDHDLQVIKTTLTAFLDIHGHLEDETMEYFLSKVQEVSDKLEDVKSIPIFS
jgi:hypothetical protein